MADLIYTNASETSREKTPQPNNICVCLALGNKLLTKKVYPDNEIAYDNAYLYRFFNRPINDLMDLFELVKLLLYKPDCCVIRGVSKNDDDRIKQRRLFHGIEATIIEQNQNWFALDVDGYAISSGNLRQDAQTVLLALGLDGIEAFAIPSSGYLRKPGIRIRLFLWNSSKISCLSLKKHFIKYKHVVDPALFHPIQPIYVARPLFSGMTDPCRILHVWLTGAQMYTEIPNVYVVTQGQENKYSVKQAKRFRDNVFHKIPEQQERYRHDWLFQQSVFLGKLIAQELIDEVETIEELETLCYAHWRGNRRKDTETIRDGIVRGKNAMGGNDGEF